MPVTSRRRRAKQQEVVVNTVGFRCKAMVAAATLSTIHHQAITLLSNNRGVLKMVTTKIPFPFPLLVGNLLHQALAALHADFPRHLWRLMDPMEEGRHTRRRAILNRSLKVTMHPVVALRTTTIVAGQATLTEEKTGTRTEDSEIRTADTDKPLLDTFLLIQKGICMGRCGGRVVITYCTMYMLVK